MLARDDGRLDEARELLREGIGIHRAMGSQRWLGIDLARLANVLALAGEACPAATLLAASERIREEIGVKEFWWAEERNQKTLELIREQLDEAAFDEAWKTGSSLSLGQAVELALEPGELSRD
jgi:hypothetical protein